MLNQIPTWIYVPIPILIDKICKKIYLKGVVFDESFKYGGKMAIFTPFRPLFSRLVPFNHD